MHFHYNSTCQNAMDKVKRSGRGWSALHCMAAAGTDLDGVRRALQEGDGAAPAAATARDAEGFLPLHCALLGWLDAARCDPINRPPGYRPAQDTEVRKEGTTQQQRGGTLWDTGGKNPELGFSRVGPVAFVCTRGGVCVFIFGTSLLLALWQICRTDLDRLALDPEM